MKGLGTSSALVEQVYDLCAHDVKLRVMIVWRNLMRVLARVEIAPGNLADELKQAVASYTEASYTVTVDRLVTIARNAGFEPWQSLADAREREQKWFMQR